MVRSAVAHTVVAGIVAVETSPPNRVTAYKQRLFNPMARHSSIDVVESRLSPTGTPDCRWFDSVLIAMLDRRDDKGDDMTRIAAAWVGATLI